MLLFCLSGRKSEVSACKGEWVLEVKVDNLCPALCLFLPVPSRPRTPASLSYCAHVREQLRGTRSEIRQQWWGGGAGCLDCSVPSQDFWALRVLAEARGASFLQRGWIPASEATCSGLSREKGSPEPSGMGQQACLAAGAASSGRRERPLGVQSLSLSSGKHEPHCSG